LPSNAPQGGQQDCHQQRNNGNHHQKLYERESFCFARVSHGSFSLKKGVFSQPIFHFLEMKLSAMKYIYPYFTPAAGGNARPWQKIFVFSHGWQGDGQR
jgi:hypothetical protein